VRRRYAEANLCACGAYEIAPSEADAAVSLFATGSEVSIAVEAKALLDARDIPSRVVSIPSFERFFEQDEAYRQATRGSAPVRVGIEAAVRQGWDAVIGTDGIFIGMSTFGASGPYEDLYRHFGITAEAVVEQVTARLANERPAKRDVRRPRAG
jgi:transketolase